MSNPFYGAGVVSDGQGTYDAVGASNGQYDAVGQGGKVTLGGVTGETSTEDGFANPMYGMGQAPQSNQPATSPTYAMASNVPVNPQLSMSNPGYASAAMSTPPASNDTYFDVAPKTAPQGQESYLDVAAAPNTVSEDQYTDVRRGYDQAAPQIAGYDTSSVPTDGGYMTAAYDNSSPNTAGYDYASSVAQNGSPQYDVASPSDPVYDQASGR
jgi:hypothetical protein